MLPEFQGNIGGWGLHSVVVGVDMADGFHCKILTKSDLTHIFPPLSQLPLVT